jgi:hypothetical protein
MWKFLQLITILAVFRAIESENFRGDESTKGENESEFGKFSS